MNDRFRLTPVLNHRKHLEEQAQQDFAEACRAADEARSKLRQMQNRCTAHETDLRDRQKQTGNVAGIVLRLQYLRRLKHEIDLQKGILEQLENAREAQRELLLEAVKNRKAIEKLEGKQKADRRRHEKQNAKKLMDDISVTRFAANHRSRRDKTPRPAGSESRPSGKNFPERKSLPPNTPDATRPSSNN